MPAVYDTGSRGVEDDGVDEDLVFVTAFNNANGTSLSSYGIDQGRNQIDENNCYGPDDSIGEQWSEVNNNGLYDPSVKARPGPISMATWCLTPLKGAAAAV